MEVNTPVLLAVGTTHPLNVAGVGLDARIAPLLGVRVVTVVAGVSAQDADNVLARTAVDEGTIAAQFAALHDVQLGAVHVGALLDAAGVAAVARGLEALDPIPVVCDPVIAATGGGLLAEAAAVAALRDVLFKHCALITPNLHEAGQLLGRVVADVADMEAAAVALLATGAKAVLIKGGHLNDAPTDVLASDEGITRLLAKRIAAKLRGTGDLLACAIAARLAYGEPLGRSVDVARAFVAGCIAAGVPFAGTRTIP